MTFYLVINKCGFYAGDTSSDLLFNVFIVIFSTKGITR